MVPDQTGLSVEQFVLNSVREGSHLVTDGAAVFRTVAGPWPDDPEQVPRTGTPSTSRRGGGRMIRTGSHTSIA